jgi:hypothetical protein
VFALMFFGVTELALDVFAQAQIRFGLAVTGVNDLLNDVHIGHAVLRWFDINHMAALVANYIRCVSRFAHVRILMSMRFLASKPFTGMLFSDDKVCHDRTIFT